MMQQRQDRRSSLQDADWRFLVPLRTAGFAHLVLLNGGEAMAERLREMGVARTLSCGLPAAGTADLVIVLSREDAPTRTFAEVAACLAPGGVLYWEVDRGARSAPRSLGALRRAVGDAGLFVSGIHAIRSKGLAAGSRHYLPIEIPGALSWYVEALLAPATVRTRLFHIVMQSCPALGRRILLWSSRYLAVTATAGAVDDIRPSVLGLPGLPASVREQACGALLLTHAGDRLVVLPFAAGGGRPLAIVKVPKLPGFNSRTENEHAVLGALRSRLPEGLRGAIPQPLGLLRQDGLSIAVESCLEGRRLGTSAGPLPASPRSQLADLTLAAAWLAEFHARTEVQRPPWGVAERARWVTGPCESFRRAYGTTTAEDRLLAAAEQYAASLGGVSFPMVWQHRDFKPRNVLRAGRELAVIDWEGCRPGPALCDLLFFLTRWYAGVRRERQETARLERFRALWFEPSGTDPYLRASRRAIVRYCCRIGLDRRFVPLLLIYTFLELTLRRSEQQRLQGEPGTNPREGNDNFGYIAVLAEHAGRLLGAGARARRLEAAATGSGLAAARVP